MAVSAPIKIFALVALLAAFALAAGMTMLGRGQAAADAAPLVLPTKKTASVLPTPAPAKKAATKPEAAAPAPAPKAKAKPAPKPQPVVAANGLPTRIVLALRRSDVVVVALWGTGGKIDALARDEAEAGAKLAGAGFVAVNVIESGREARALTLEAGGVLRSPSVLLFTGSETLANRLDGFRDRDLVAQAALSALR